jgi:hypothetical protein
MAEFQPSDPLAHARVNSGDDVPDPCANCGLDFMEHTGGVCPLPDDDYAGKVARIREYLRSKYNAGRDQ